MKKSDEAKKVFGAIVILAIIVSVFGGVVSAVDLSRGVTQSVADAEIHAAVGNLSSEELTKSTALDKLGAVTDGTVNIAFANQSAELGVVSSRSSYDRQAAYNYAMQWWNSCNHFCSGSWNECSPYRYYGWEYGCCDGAYSSHGGDCANFVSQCLIAGGHPYLTGEPDCKYPDGTLCCRGDCGKAEVGAKRLGDCLVAKGWERTCGYHASPPSNIDVGDVLIYHTDSCDDWSAHATIVTYVSGSDVKITCHSENRKNEPYTYLSTLRPYYEWLHYPESVVQPTVETRSATSITETAATLNGEITDDGGASIDERGLLWGEGDTLTDLTKDVTISGNHFSFCLTGLKSDTKYSFMAYAKNSAGTGESNILSFTTLAECPTPGTPSNPSPSNHATDVSINTDLDWSDCSNTDFYDVYFGTYSPPPYYGSAPTSSYPFQNDLEHGTKYYWKIVAKSNCGGITQGPIWDFNTEENPNTCDGTDTSCGIYPNCENCNNYDGWYCNGNTREYRNFYCSGTSCTDTVTSSDNCNNYDGCSAYSNGCENRDYYCSGGSCVYTHSNRHTDYYDDWDYYCDGDTVRKHRLFHDYYCDGGTCTDHTRMEDDQLVENCNDHDGWVDTGNTDWVEVNDCQEKEKKEQEYRDYSCSGGACTYSVTGTPRWIDTGTMQNKDDGTICGCTASNTLKRCYSGVCTDTGICDSTTCGADAACDGKRPGDSCGGGICDSNCKCGGQAVGEDYGVFRNGRWFIDTTGNQKTNLYFWYGTTGDKPVVGDFNDDGSDDYGVFRNGRWYIDTTGNHKTNLGFWYGTTGDIPVVGNFGGDDGYGVFRNGRWYIDTTGNHKTNLCFWYGTTEDKPVVGNIG